MMFIIILQELFHKDEVKMIILLNTTFVEELMDQFRSH